MLGLRPEVDPYASVLSHGGHQPKTWKFSERLSGRFFVSGVSGGFRRAKRVHINDETPSGRESSSSLRKKTEDQIRKDAQHLYELETQLRELQERKLLRQRRDVMRHRRREEYLAACCIQRVIRRYIKHREQSRSRFFAIEVISSFLRMLAAKQAISAAGWAAAVIARFAQRVTGRWLRRRKAAAARRLAMRQIRKKEEERRRHQQLIEVREDFLQDQLQQPLQPRVQDESIGAIEQRDDISRGTGFPADISAAQESATEHTATSYVPDNNLLSARSVLSTQSISSTTARAGLRSDLAEASFHELELRAKKALRTTAMMQTESNSLSNDSDAQRALVGRVAGAVNGDQTEVNDSAEERESLRTLHEQKLREMELERLRRLRAVEAARLAKAVELQQRARQQARERAEREKAKNEFLRRLALEQAQQAREQAKIRAERERIAALRLAEAEQVIAEKKLMYREDTRLQNRFIIRRRKSSNEAAVPDAKRVRKPSNISHVHSRRKVVGPVKCEESVAPHDASQDISGDGSAENERQQSARFEGRESRPECEDDEEEDWRASDTDSDSDSSEEEELTALRLEVAAMQREREETHRLQEQNRLREAEEKRQQEEAQTKEREARRRRALQNLQRRVALRLQAEMREKNEAEQEQLAKKLRQAQVVAAAQESLRKAKSSAAIGAMKNENKENDHDVMIKQRRRQTDQHESPLPLALALIKDKDRDTRQRKVSTTDDGNNNMQQQKHRSSKKSGSTNKVKQRSATRSDEISEDALTKDEVTGTTEGHLDAITPGADHHSNSPLPHNLTNNCDNNKLNDHVGVHQRPLQNRPVSGCASNATRKRSSSSSMKSLSDIPKQLQDTPYFQDFQRHLLKRRTSVERGGPLRIEENTTGDCDVSGAISSAFKGMKIASSPSSVPHNIGEGVTTTVSGDPKPSSLSENADEHFVPSGSSIESIRLAEKQAAPISAQPPLPSLDAWLASQPGISLSIPSVPSIPSSLAAGGGDGGAGYPKETSMQKISQVDISKVASKPTKLTTESHEGATTEGKHAQKSSAKVDPKSNLRRHGSKREALDDEGKGGGSENRLGRVGSLLAMVARARKKLGDPDTTSEVQCSHQLGKQPTREDVVDSAAVHRSPIGSSSGGNGNINGNGSGYGGMPAITQPLPIAVPPRGGRRIPSSSKLSPAYHSDILTTATIGPPTGPNTLQADGPFSMRPPQLTMAKMGFGYGAFRASCAGGSNTNYDSEQKKKAKNAMKNKNKKKKESSGSSCADSSAKVCEESTSASTNFTQTAPSSTHQGVHIQDAITGDIASSNVVADESSSSCYSTDFDDDKIHSSDDDDDADAIEERALQRKCRRIRKRLERNISEVTAPQAPSDLVGDHTHPDKQVAVDQNVNYEVSGETHHVTSESPVGDSNVKTINKKTTSEDIDVQDRTRHQLTGRHARQSTFTSRLQNIQSSIDADRLNRVSSKNKVSGPRIYDKGPDKATAPVRSTVRGKGTNVIENVTSRRREPTACAIEETSATAPTQDNKQRRRLQPHEVSAMSAADILKFFEEQARLEEAEWDEESGQQDGDALDRGEVEENTQSANDVSSSTRSIVFISGEDKAAAELSDKANIGSGLFDGKDDGDFDGEGAVESDINDHRSPDDADAVLFDPLASQEIHWQQRPLYPSKYDDYDEEAEVLAQEDDVDDDDDEEDDEEEEDDGEEEEFGDYDDEGIWRDEAVPSQLKLLSSLPGPTSSLQASQVGAAAHENVSRTGGVSMRNSEDFLQKCQELQRSLEKKVGPITIPTTS